MSPQQKASGGGSRKSGKGAGQKDSTVAVEQSNNQNSTTNKKHNNASSNVNNTNIDQSKTEKEKPHIKPTAEQIRIAQITEIKNGTQDPTREKVIQLMEATERSEEDACLALYECDNDLERAVIYLLENLEVGALITTTKKKKTKAASDGNEGDEFESSNTNNRDSNRGGGGDGSNERYKGRISNRGGASQRGRSRVAGDSRGNDNGEGGNSMRGMRGRGDGTRRGGFSGRGRGGRGGPRVRDQNHRINNYRTQQPEHQQEIDNWDPTSTQITNDTKNDETWGDCGDWDNEEYTGSLSDTKVFTPSTQPDLSAPPGLEQQILNPPQSDVNQYNPAVVSSGSASGQYGDLHSTTAAQQLRQALEMPSMSQQPSAPLSAEQSQYFNTLGTQNTNAAYQSSVQYQYNDQVVSNQQAPRSQAQAQAQVQAQQQQQQRSRARVPPPSKIPSSAVEMPDVDLPVYLDVQFGGLDFGTGTEEQTYETEKYSQGLDQSTGDDYTANKSNVVTKSSQSALSGLQPSQLIQTAESISSSTQADLSSSYAQRNASSMGASGQSTLDQLTKTGDIYASNAASGNAYQNLSYQSSQKTGGYQTSGYGSNAYNSSQSTNNYPASTNSYGYNQNSYQQQNQSTQSGTGQQQIQSTGNVSNNSSNPNQTTSGYMGNQYQGNQTGYQSQQSSYQNQSVYGNSNNINSNSEFSGSINSLTSKLKSTQGTYDSSTNAVSSGTSSTSSNTAITTSSISTSLGLNSAKSTTSTSGMKTGASQVSSSTNVTTNTSSGVGTTANTGNGASNVVQNIPLMSSYIQPAFYQQQPYLHFEDMQLVQPRMTPMTGYYEYQTPTSLAGVRSDGTASNLASVAYPTMSADGRFARTDNNSSPVQSQQTAGSSQLMNLPPYAYFYGTNVMPAGSFQQFPQIYSQMPATNPNAGQFAKQSAYNSGYGSTGYDTLNQTAPDYNKTTYQSTGQQTKGHSTTNQSGTNSDIASSMYNKSHVTLNKVNSYDKQSFHSGTPPPFNLGSQAGSQTQAFQQHLYLQPMAPHHNMHQPIHQMEGGRITNSRRDTNSSGQRQQTGSQSKSGSKPAYSTSTYWNPQN
ncbi:protein lingerer isoform X2 [Chironomus tepperi]|uniref:protein lingerer isoform X2 n=1 Tax=Chironomus tepperi TaxID=113505 RepID=UPI00391F799F